MNNKILTIAALAAVLVSGIFATTPMAAYASDDGDYSGTETEQEIKQKNSGGDGSTNINCADNDINSGSGIDAQVCGTLGIGAGDGDNGGNGGGDGDFQVPICHRPPGNPENEQEISVGISALPAHLAHGDSLGSC